MARRKICIMSFGNIIKDTKPWFGTTPYNLVYGFDVILTIDFLIPTLHVATSLGWIGYKFLNRFIEFEKRNEIRRFMVVGMYAKNDSMSKMCELRNFKKEIWSLYVYTVCIHTKETKCLDEEPLAYFINCSCMVVV